MKSGKPDSQEPPADILIVEDSPTQARQLQFILETGGYRVTLAPNGLEALETARRIAPTLIISDVNMPEMDGYELCRQLKSDAVTASIPVILVTALSDPHDVIRGLESGADHFIPKPYDPKQLVARVQILLLNRTVNHVDRPGMGLEIYFNGQRHFITADRLQILNLLLSTYEAAVEKNRKLDEAQGALRDMNRNLERLVAERTRKLVATEERFRQLAENSEEVFWFASVDPEEILYMSPAVERVWQLPAETFYNSPRKRLEAAIPEDRERVRLAYEDAVSGRTATYTAEYRIERPDGSICWISDQGTPIRDENGEIVRIGGVCRDVTEQKLAQERLAESERFNRATLDALSTYIAVLDGEGRLVFTNRAWQDFSSRSGWPVNRGQDRPNYLSFCDRSSEAGAEGFGNIAAVIRATIAGQCEGGHFEYATQAADGPKWFFFRVSRFPGDRNLRLVVSHTDITARKLAELAMQRSQQQFRDLFESAPDAMIIADTRGTIKLVNQQAERIFGWTREELMGRSVESLMKPEAAGGHPTLRQTYMKSAAPQRMGSGRSVLHAIRKDESEFPVEITLSPLESEDDALVVAAVRDVTERMQLEAQFLQAQKMEGVGQLAGGIAHDFNNLLTVINGTAELAMDNLPEENPLRADLTEILETGIRAASLTRQLLAFSRKQILQPQLVNLNRVVTEAQGMLRRVIGENIDLIFVPDDNLGSTRVDPAQIDQVIVNLAVNSRDAMPNGGKLTIETRNVLVEEAEGKLQPALPAGAYVALSVSDTGAGMDESTQRRIFEPFFTTKSVGKGTGLGLSTAFGIIKQSGGDIRAYSEVGKGTVFRIYLPRVGEEAERAEPEPVPTIARGTETILVVDDDEAIVNVAKRILEASGYTVLTATSAEEGMQQIEQGDKNISLVLTDVVMAGKSGVALADYIRESCPGIKVLYASGYTDDTIIRHGILSEDVQFISKPYLAVELTRKIRSTLDTKEN